MQCCAVFSAFSIVHLSTVSINIRGFRSMKADWSVYMDLATNSSEVQRRIRRVLRHTSSHKLQIWGVWCIWLTVWSSRSICRLLQPPWESVTVNSTWCWAWMMWRNMCTSRYSLENDTEHVYFTIQPRKWYILITWIFYVNEENRDVQIYMCIRIVTQWRRSYSVQLLSNEARSKCS